MADDVVLELVGVGKTYGERVAVKSVDLTIKRGEIFGFLGPNGAGKTSTISIACGVIPATRGTVKIAGHDLATDTAAAKRAIGLVPQDLALYEELSPRQNLAFFGQLYGLRGAELTKAIDHALGVAELADRADDVVKSFSGGMKRRLNLAAGMVHGPTLLVLDEPTVGVDPQSRRHIFDAIRASRDRGMTVIYTSHYMEEVEELCDRIAIMDQGSVVAQGTLAELTAKHAQPGVEIELENGDADLAALRSAIEAAGGKVKSIGAKRGDLETVFLALTGRAMRDH